MTVITVNMHEHKWDLIPNEPLFVGCNCGFFRKVDGSDGSLYEPTRDELIQLTDRINNRMERLIREHARKSGLFVPKSEIEKGY